MAKPLPKLFAHRLGRHYGADNSAAALRGSLSGHLEGLETDICLTADDQLVLLHDPLLVLGTTLEGWASQRTAQEIRSSWILDQGGLPSGEQPLSLDELLELVPASVELQLEVKAHADPALARCTAEVLCGRLADEPARERFEVISFHRSACEVAARHGLAARLVIWADYAPQALSEWALESGVGGISVEHFLLTRQLVDALRAVGLSVNTGTVNRPELLSRLLELEPDAIGTDRPHELRAAMEPARFAQ